MSTLDRRDIGYAHNRLDNVAKQLHIDSRHDDAHSYQKRADVEQAVYDDLMSLAEKARRLTAKGERDQWKCGADLVDYLLERGWTPPAHFNGRITE